VPAQKAATKRIASVSMAAHSLRRGQKATKNPSREGRGVRYR
jgi:hypothetical protein